MRPGEVVYVAKVANRRDAHGEQVIERAFERLPSFLLRFRRSRGGDQSDGVVAENPVWRFPIRRIPDDDAANRIRRGGVDSAHPQRLA